VASRRHRSTRRRRRVARLRLPRFDGRARWLALAALGSALGYVLALNALVSAFGGAVVHPLAVSHEAEKSEALGRLALHAVGELGLWPHPDARPVVTAAAARHGVSRTLALAVARVESGFDPHAISGTGAMGLMQLMPDTARDLGVADPYEPAANADAAVRYLDALCRRYSGDLGRAVAAYNVGPARVPVAGAVSLPAETRAYVAAVQRIMRQSATPRASYLAASRANTLQRGPR